MDPDPNLNQEQKFRIRKKSSDPLGFESATLIPTVLTDRYGAAFVFIVLVAFFGGKNIHFCIIPHLFIEVLL